MVNTVLFKEKWKMPFDTVEKGPWYKDGDEFQVDFMRYYEDQKLRHAREYANNDGDHIADYVSLPFADGKSMMTFAMPSKNSKLEDLQFSRLQHVQKELKDSPFEIELYLPKFKFEYSMNVKDVLQNKNISDIFNPERASLSRTMEDADGLYVSDFMHKATIEVDENGATAAAASGAKFTFHSAPPRYIFDRPFKFFISDSHYTMPIFIGQVTCPSGVCEKSDDDDGIK